VVITESSDASLILCLLIYFLNYTGFSVTNGTMMKSEGHEQLSVLTFAFKLCGKLLKVTVMTAGL